MRAVAFAFVLLVSSLAPAAPAPAKAAAQAPRGDELEITAANPTARAAFARGRSLYYNLRTDEARRAVQDAVKADQGCGMGWAYVALTSRPVAAGKDAVEKAVKLAPRLSAGERLFIEALAAQVKGDVATEDGKREALVAMYPKDWRVLVARGNRLIHLQRPGDAVAYLERAVAAAPDEAAPYNDLGYAFAGAGKLDEAVRAMTKYAALLPSEPNPHDSLAEILLRAGKTREAMAEYEKALEVDPTFVIANEGLGHARLLSGDFDGAREAYRRLADGAETPFDRFTGLDWIAATYAHEGRTDETIRQLEEAEAAAVAAREPAWTLMFPVRRALALVEVGRFKDAIELAESVAKKAEKAPVSPSLKLEISVRAEVAKGMASARTVDANGGLAVLEALNARLVPKGASAKDLDPKLLGLANALAASVAVVLEPAESKEVLLSEVGLEENPWGLALLADAAEHQGREQDANALRDRALKMNVVTPELGFVRPRLLGGKSLAAGAHFGPVPVTTRSSAALALFIDARRLGETYKRSVAVAGMEKAIALDPEFALADLFLSIFTDSPEDGAQALDNARKLADLGKVSDGEKLLIDAHVVASKGDLAGKEKRLEELAALYPNDWRPAAYLGEHLFRMGRRAESILPLQAAVKRSPGEPYPYNGLGYAFAYEGRFEEGIAALKKYAELSPGESNPHDSLAEVYLMAGRPKDAEVEYRRSLELSPQFVPSYEGLGHSRLLAGNFGGAREAYRQMAQLATLSMDRTAAQTWLALTFAYEGRFDEAAASLGRAEIQATAAKDRLGEALLEARRVPLMAEAGRAKDGVLLAAHVLQSTKGRLSPAALAMVERLMLFGRGWAQLANNDLPAAKATAKELQGLALKSQHLEAITLATVLVAAVALAEDRAPDAVKALEPADRHHPLVQALLSEAYAKTGQAAKAEALRALVLRPTANHVDLALARRRLAPVTATAGK